jgi:short-subunit dehydrogenase
MKTAIITGASGGIGKELVKLFLTNNWKVLAVSRNTKALEDIKHKELIVLEADINKKEDREKIEKLADTLSPIEVLINNAGKLLNKPFSGIDEKELQEVYSANVFAPFHFI